MRNITLIHIRVYTGEIADLEIALLCHKLIKSSGEMGLLRDIGLQCLSLSLSLSRSHLSLPYLALYYNISDNNDLKLKAVRTTAVLLCWTYFCSEISLCIPAIL